MSIAIEAGGVVMSKGDRPHAALCAAVAQEMRVARGLLEELAAVLVADERSSATMSISFRPST